MSLTFLQKTLELAKIRRGFCSPNPAVGAVIVSNNRVVGTGYHWGTGHPHAEVVALEQAGSASCNATLYVSLEPCCHYTKKTPPCTNLIIKKGISKLIYAFQDPNPEVAGCSLRILRESGINCYYQPLPEADDFYRSYQFWWKNQKPFVTAKLAMSLDSKIAADQGQRINLTGDPIRHYTHTQRKQSDAILTTIKTVLQDNPLLNVRLDTHTYSKRLYILDSRLQLPLQAKLFTTASSITIFHQEEVESEKIAQLIQHGVRCVSVPKKPNGLLDWETLLTVIGQSGEHDLWVEAGGTCFSSLSKSKQLQRGLIYIAPIWLGDKSLSAFSHKLPPARSVRWFNLGIDAVCELLYEK